MMNSARYFIFLWPAFMPFLSVCQKQLLESTATEQCILVVTDDDHSSEGTLFFFEKNRSLSKWKSLMKTDVSIGKNGSAWGHGLHPFSWIKPVMKKEGDGKSPRGIYETGFVFGYDPPDPRIRRYYKQADDSCFCVDDTSSAYYNFIVNMNEFTGTIDWNSAEEMRRTDSLYMYGLVIRFNDNPVVKGAGSCIFLHIWRGKGLGTAGCTALAYDEILDLLYLLKPNKKCLYILLTREEYKKYRRSIGLPKIPQ